MAQQQIINATGMQLIFEDKSTLGSLYNLEAHNSQTDDIIAIKIGGRYLPAHPLKVNNFVDFPSDLTKLPRDSVIIVTMKVGLTLAARSQEVPCRIVIPEGVVNADGDFEVQSLHYLPDCKPPVIRETF